MSNPFERLRAITRWGATDDADLAAQAAGALASMAREPAGLVVACRRLLAHHPGNAVLWWVCARVLAADDPVTAARACVQQLDRDATADRLAASLPLQPGDALCASLGWPRAVDMAFAERADLDVVAVRAEGVDTVAEVRNRDAQRPVAVIDTYALAARDVSHLLVPALAIGDGRALVPAGAADALTEVPARTLVWLVAGVGRVLPNRLWQALVAATGATDVVASALVEDLPLVCSLERFDRVAGPSGVEVPTEAAARPDCPVPAELLRPLD